MRVDPAGVSFEHIRVDVCDAELTVSGERAPDAAGMQQARHQTERAYECFSRPIPRPAGAWPRRARPTLDTGVLEIRVPVCLPATGMPPLGARTAVAVQARGTA